ncbi:MAG: dihydroorotate dehydrogenase (quinone) [Pelagibacterales bacterium]|nr:dihydroorotate dehydrogenase (quinone) [Pelagibacterales bacterium]OUU61378.1 MAG: dihydroorotate dehydrogenase (quinone) [Alphaproteobacteria bacterium TMED62]|tara:strand:- start:2985 stop:4034 length:1050 start_codon:yes stop_codon:yes gene_type:complete
MLEKIFLILLLKLPEEISHNIAIFLLKYNLIPSRRKLIINSTKTKLFNYKLSHPVGLAAGFDKNAEALPGLLKQNFSFIEIGTVTPLPQAGNSKPRIFRLLNEKSIINKLGFPNLGSSKIFNNINKIRKFHSLGLEPLIGVNIGCNKSTKSPLKDYEKCFDIFSSVADYITINVSSPNTPGLRKLQLKTNLDPLLKKISKKRELYFKKYKRNIPLALKIAPDLSNSDLENIVTLIQKYNIEGIIATNTSLNKKLVKNEKLLKLQGGISGNALYTYSNDILKRLQRLSKGKVQIIGVGGIDNGAKVLEKITLGADAVQLYSSLVYNGISIVDKIILDLIDISKKVKKSHD